MSRPYTGYDGTSTRRRPGLEAFAAEIQTLTGGALWNNGTLVIRAINGGTSPSVHATGRAVDLSHRPMGDHRRGSTRAEALPLLDRLIVAANDLELEMAIDYGAPARVWRCDRSAWRPNTQVRGVSDSFHIELSPAMADDPDRARAAVRAALETEAAVTPPRYPGRPLQLGSKGISVERVQNRLSELGLYSARIDGSFGPITDAGVRRFQLREAPPVDGIVGPITWRQLFPA
jgi:hypothetical protein